MGAGAVILVTQAHLLSRVAASSLSAPPPAAIAWSMVATRRRQCDG